MTPGMLTTEIVLTVKLTLVTDDKAISEDSAVNTTAPWVARTLIAASAAAGAPLDVTVVPRSHMIYDLRGLPKKENDDA